MQAPVTVALAALLLVGLTGCGLAADDSTADTTSHQPPAIGDCRMLTPSDLDRPSNDSPLVGCGSAHTAETFEVETIPDEVAEGGLDNPALGTFVYKTCNSGFRRFLGGEESAVMRSMLTWAWFRPTREEWNAGARWYRCDAVGGGEQSTTFVNLPRTARGLLLGRPEDRWMVCVDGPSVNGAEKIPCSQKHTWRAATTIVLGKDTDPYPGDRLVEIRTRDFCSDSVGAWMNYPVDYDFGYTWFHEAEWKAGNRRSICWARTNR